MGFLTELEGKKLPMAASQLALDDLMVSDFMKRIFAPHTAGQVFEWEKYLTANSADIVYRREVLKELAACPALIEKMKGLCACINMITRLKDEHMSSEYGPEAFREFGIMREAYDQMKEMQESLQILMEDGTVASRGLVKMCEMLREKLHNNFCDSFPQDWDTMTSGMEKIGSMTLRFTLDDEMHVQGASIVALHKQKYSKGGFLQWKKEMMHTEHPWELNALKEMTTPTEELLGDELRFNQRQFYQRLYRMTLDLDDLYQDLIFYLGALEYCSKMAEAGVSLCLPQILPMEHKGYVARNMINPVLVIMNPSKKPVPNDVDFRKGGEIFLLTGINQGGKTTFLRTVGTIQVLFQLGWPVPATEASISLVDKIVTVFSHEENTALQHGKLGQELKTMKQGMEEATVDSLLLCNEPITGTSPMENLYLSRVVLTSCKVNGYKGIWVTHLYDLANRAQAMNEELPGSTISSLVARAVERGNTVDASYRIERGNPAFTSYAREVMRKEASL
ncbi:MAG: hypothetical protein IJ315_05385 [Firmicutes bacterium]|nr:hypothetical protein [Bacillota bacterium]